MIIIAKDNSCLASGTVTKKGAELRHVGKAQIPKLSFSVCIENKKGEGGEYKPKYLECELFGQKRVDEAPKIIGGSMILCAGTISNRKWTDREGAERTFTTLECDSVFVSPKSYYDDESMDYANSAQGFHDIDEDSEGDLPF